MTYHRLVWPLLVVLCFNDGAVARKDLRLPNAVIPESYRIKILPMFVEGDFRLFGNVRMDFFIVEPTDRIVMHAVNLTIDDGATIVLLANESHRAVKRSESPHDQEDDPLEVATEIVESDAGFRVTYDAEKEFVIFELPWTLRVGRRYRIQFGYRGQLSQGLEGLYLSHYIDRQSGSKR